MKQATFDQPITVVHERVRRAAASQGWLLSTGGPAHGPNQPLIFRKGLGSFQPAAGLAVELTAVDANRTTVGVSVWRGTVEIDGYDADRLLQAL